METADSDRCAIWANAGIGCIGAVNLIAGSRIPISPVFQCRQTSTMKCLTPRVDVPYSNDRKQKRFVSPGAASPSTRQPGLLLPHRSSRSMIFASVGFRVPALASPGLIIRLPGLPTRSSPPKPATTRSVGTRSAENRSVDDANSPGNRPGSTWPLHSANQPQSPEPLATGMGLLAATSS